MKQEDLPSKTDETSTPIPEASGMVEITHKPEVKRTALASGRIILRGETVQAIRSREVEKGEALATARAAALLAVKDTPRLIPMCHPIPITGIQVSFRLEETGVEARVRVTSTGRTGVEMEALVGVSAALLTIWDMVKSLEKDSTGNYPQTCIQEIRVLEKVKGSP